MTRVEFLQAVVDGVVSDDVKAYAKVRLDKENARTDARKSASLDKMTATKTALADIGSGFHTAKEIAELTDYSARTIQYYLGVLVKEGSVVKDGNSPIGYKVVD